MKIVTLSDVINQICDIKSDFCDILCDIIQPMCDAIPDMFSFDLSQLFPVLLIHRFFNHSTPIYECSSV